MGDEADADWEAGLIELGQEHGFGCEHGHDWQVMRRFGPVTYKCRRCGKIDYSGQEPH